MIRVVKDMVVSFRYIMKNSREEVLENTIDGLPTAYLHGHEGIHPVLQSQLEGLVTGDKKLVSLLKSSGLINEDYHFDIIIDGVREALAEEIMLGYPVLPPAERCGMDCNCYV